MNVWKWLRGKKTAIGAGLNLLVQIANSQWPEYQELWSKVFEFSNYVLVFGLADKGIKAIPNKYVPVKALKTPEPPEETVSEPKPYQPED